MKLYAKLALDGMRKNKQLYVPYLLTCGSLVMMSYFMSFLVRDPILAELPFMGSLTAFFEMGYGILAVFALIFLFYTNSFLMRRRKKEFGLYHVLGMGKGALGQILLWETIFTAAVALACGLAAGAVFSKLVELGFLHIMKAEVSYRLAVPLQSLLAPVRTYLPIFLLLYLNNWRQIRFSGALTLLGSEQSGEKPPKANWLLGLGGVALLAAAYYLAVEVAEPASALAWFFIAVVIVIAATYLLMIFGSVLLCRVLQKNKHYYYQKHHFVSVSSMAYRMKRNGAGLASVCILATMVLVTLSSTACLYLGVEDAVAARYPREINFQVDADSREDLLPCVTAIRADIDGKAPEYGVEPQNAVAWTSRTLIGYVQENQVEVQKNLGYAFNMEAMPYMNQIVFLSLEDYNAMMDTRETLAAGEALLYLNRGSYPYETMEFVGGGTLTIKRQLDGMLANRQAAMNAMPSMILVVTDPDAAVAPLESGEEQRMFYSWNYSFDTGLDEAGQADYWEGYTPLGAERESLQQLYQHSCVMESRAMDRENFLALYGGLFYLGILLSVVFLFAAVLILYYKQISEGYEDQARFDIMQKVGMTKAEIRKSINSQLLTVFFLPLLLAGCHLIFAFPMVQKIMMMFNLTNTTLFMATSGVCFAVFALFYVVVYRVTSNAYYRLISGGRA